MSLRIGAFLRIGCIAPSGGAPMAVPSSAPRVVVKPPRAPDLSAPPVDSPAFVDLQYIPRLEKTTANHITLLFSELIRDHLISSLLWSFLFSRWRASTDSNSLK